MEYAARYNSPIGPIVLTSDRVELTGLRFETVETIEPFVSIESLAIFEEVRHWLDLYFSCRQPDFIPPIKFVCTDFQHRVWQALLDVPYGETTTYGALARRLGCRSAQAVGQAVGRNPIAIIVPCHRVIGNDGSLTGYAYGIDKKEYLLQLESRHRLTVTR